MRITLENNGLNVENITVIPKDVDMIVLKATSTMMPRKMIEANEKYLTEKFGIKRVIIGPHEKIEAVR